ncbi:MAG: helix-turn-helix transcriptional regulator [Eggerthellaceae bacterium]|nr:helix-turn-helix transcriptional regulator [Eggerthellaceae bacterium]
MRSQEYEMFQSQLGARIKQVRLSLGFLQEDVAEILGMSRVAIGYIEQGRRAPKLSTLYALANLYEVDIRTFFDFQDAPPGA